jgi:hypothetical protein
MTFRRRAIAVVFLAAATLGSLGAPAMAAPPVHGDAGRTSALVSTPVERGGTVSVRCGNPCYQ